MPEPGTLQSTVQARLVDQGRWAQEELGLSNAQNLLDALGSLGGS